MIIISSASYFLMAGKAKTFYPEMFIGIGLQVFIINNIRDKINIAGRSARVKR
jgi:hypothetical protein